MDNKKSYNNLLKNNNNFNNIFNNNNIFNKNNRLRLQNNSKIFEVIGKKDKFQGKKFIIKKTKIKNENGVLDFDTLHSSQNECKIYKYIKNLVKYNICPFIYYGLQCKIDDKYSYLILNTFQGEKTELKNLEEILDLLINQTSKRLNLQEFYIILFQIIYTLKCFNLIGIKHNDLHLGNILIEINNKVESNDKVESNKNNVNNNTYEYNRYIVDENSFEIPNCKYTVKIYDFDFSIKFNRNQDLLHKGKQFKDCFKDDKIQGFNIIDFKKVYGNETFLNNVDDVNFDLLKLLSIIYNILKNKLIELNKLNIITSKKKIFIQDILNFMNTLFKQTNDNFNNILSTDYDTYYNFPENSIFLNQIKSLDDILVLISQKIYLKKNMEAKIIKEYNINNLYIKNVSIKSTKGGSLKKYKSNYINKYKIRSKTIRSKTIRSKTIRSKIIRN